ncbi:tight adherence protein C [Phyllobacterium ifriqiyense]|uniref:Tight adherence protein C n=1 Tax=Phyllobacterium ifriqiyense TaxID=314238 RepID=A0ABU0SB56_9HYPH|nr:type II secretion system F family protein [Phyllobacterium ifriqiyense]MDQ0997998.1 tight adherence protein C [Phyllobacterium ifriqiyense]
MINTFTKAIHDPAFIFAVLVAVSIFGTIVTLLMPVFSGSTLKSRMKSVALERDQIRTRERARLATESDSKRKSSSNSLRRVEREGIRQFVERLDLQRALADEKTAGALRIAGFRGQNALNIFLAARFGLPFLTLGIAALWIFAMGGLAHQNTFVRMAACFAGAYVGFYLPNLYVKNAGTKRQTAIQAAWPDALDLLLICVESGMSIEAAFKKVSEEIGVQSAELAEELVLTNAELSFLSERRQAYENLALRTGLETVKSVVQALTQSERYGTSIGGALRVLSDESREMRLMAAEKKAAALPPKLTVPMIVFLLPVLFCVILGPAIIQINAQGGIFGHATAK